MLRTLAAAFAVALFTTPSRAADEKAIDLAVEKGKVWLKAQFATGKNAAAGNNGHNFGIGPAALAGITLLEARVPADDATIKAITAAVREAAYTEHQTYQAALCLMFLDRLEDPSDVPLIQVLAYRILMGQNSAGGWSYHACDTVPPDHAAWLKANLKGDAKKAVKPRVFPEVLTYATSIKKSGANGIDDNSNTQFAILGLWSVRKHGVPVDSALDLVEKRFRGLQDAQTGGWGYMGPVLGGGPSPAGTSTASMTCCGLLGLATGNARRLERKVRVDPIPNKGPASKDDPFFSTPAKNEKPAEKAPETRDPAAIRALAGLGGAIDQFVQNGGLLNPNGRHGDRDYYLLWSIERVGVIYNVDKLGGIDWYAVGSDALVKAQLADGSWPDKSYGSDVNTCFALLFLMKADLLRDLSNKFRNPKDNELRAGTSGSVPATGIGSGNTTAPMPKDLGPKTPALPNVTQDPATKLANDLLLASEADWSKTVEKLRDAKGGDNTRGLAIAIHRLDGDRKKEAREALAERLTRMSAETLKGMMTTEDSEIRRGAVLAAAMKDDKAHVADLIDRLLDEDEAVMRAARAGLKSLTGQDLGPKNGAGADDRRAAVAAWKAWHAKQK